MDPKELMAEVKKGLIEYEAEKEKAKEDDEKKKKTEKDSEDYESLKKAYAAQTKEYEAMKKKYESKDDDDDEDDDDDDKKEYESEDDDEKKKKSEDDDKKDYQAFTVKSPSGETLRIYQANDGKTAPRVELLKKRIGASNEFDDGNKKQKLNSKHLMGLKEEVFCEGLGFEDTAKVKATLKNYSAEQDASMQRIHSDIPRKQKVVGGSNVFLTEAEQLVVRVRRIAGVHD